MVKNREGLDWDKIQNQTYFDVDDDAVFLSRLEVCPPQMPAGYRLLPILERLRNE